VPKPRVLVLYNQPVLPPDHPDYLSEIDVVETVGEVEKVLPPDQYITERFGYARDPRLLLDKFAAWKPDAVFNLFEGEADRSETEIYNAGLMEWAGVPFTGAGSLGQAIGRDKVRTKYLLRGAGVPNPPFAVVDRPPAAPWLHPWPAIVKPAYTDASIGIDQGSVVTTEPQLDARVTHVFDRFGGPVLIEQYIPGRELQIHLFDDPADGRLLVMPAAEIVFEDASDQSLWPIYSYPAKWDERSAEFKRSRLVGGITLPSPLRERVEEMCIAAYRLVGLRDYGRVDLRVTAAGEPYVLEVNPNPHLNSLILVEGLKAMGRDFGGFVRGLVVNALRRSPGGATDGSQG
jgi:D-alanine-D-alanine ligase